MYIRGVGRNRERDGGGIGRGEEEGGLVAVGS